MALIRGIDVKNAAIAQVATPGTTEVVAAPGAKSRIVVTAISVSLAAAGTLKFQSGANDLTGAQNFAANGGMSPTGSVESPILVCNRGEALNVVSAGAGAGANGWVTYYVTDSSPA